MRYLDTIVFYAWVSLRQRVTLIWNGRRDASTGLPNHEDHGYLDRLAAHWMTLREAHAGDLADRDRKDLEKRAALRILLNRQVEDEQALTAELDEIRAGYDIVSAAGPGEDVPPVLRNRRNRREFDRDCAVARANRKRIRADRQATEVQLAQLDTRIAQRHRRLDARAAEYRGWIQQMVAIYSTANARARIRGLRRKDREARR